MKQLKKLEQTILVLLLFILSVVVLYFGKPFLFPFALAGVLAMLLIQPCNWMERRKVPRGIAALLAVLGLVIALGGTFMLLGWQLSGFSENLSKIQERGMEVVGQLREWINSTLGVDHQKQEEIVKSQDSSGGDAGEMLMAFASGIFSFLVDTILVLVYIFLFLYFRNKLKNFILMLFRPDKKEQATSILQESSKVSQQYLGGLSKMIVILWIMYGIGFSVIGVEYALFFAVFCGLMEIIPFVGNFIGSVLTVIAVAMQGGDSSMILGVISIYLFVQFIQTYLLEPLVVGNEVRINPLFTIIVLVVGELVWGIGGMILAIPLLGILLIIFDHIPELKPYAYLISSDKKKNTRKKRK